MAESCPGLQKGALVTLDLNMPGVGEPQWKLSVPFTVLFVYWSGNLLPCA